MSRPSGVSQHRNGVEEILVQHPFNWSICLEPHLCTLHVAILAAEEDEV